MNRPSLSCAGETVHSRTRGLDPPTRPTKGVVDLPSRPHRVDSERWREALGSYLSIARVQRAHSDQSLSPVRQPIHASEIEQIGEEAQKLQQERIQRITTLARTPVADFADFTLKLEILFDEIFKHDPDQGALIAELVADVRALHKAAAAR